MEINLQIIQSSKWLLHIVSYMAVILNKVRINPNLFFLQKLRMKDSDLARLQTEYSGLQQQLEVCYCKEVLS